MTEVAGLAIDESITQPESAPSSEPDLGADLLPADEPHGTDESGGEQSAAAETDATNNAPPDPQEAYKSFQADYTRKMQDLAEQRRVLDAERQAAQQERQQLLDRMTQPQEQEVDPTAHLTPEQRAEYLQGLEVVRQEIARTVDPIKSQLEEALQQNQQYASALQQVQLQQFQQAQMGQQAQIVEAQEAFGQEALAGRATEIAAVYNSLRAQVNPATGQPYTVKDSAGLLLGTTADQASQARARDQQTRTQAKRRTKATVPVQGDTESSAISATEAAQLIGDLEGFE